MSGRINPKVGEFWKSRSGEKFEIIKIDAPSDCPIIAMNTKTGVPIPFNTDGAAPCYIYGSDHDLISPWVEPPPKLEAWLRETEFGSEVFRPEFFIGWKYSRNSPRRDFTIPRSLAG